MRNRRRKTSADNESHNRDRWLISYADLMTLLLALFIVMYGASDYERAHKIAASFGPQNTGGNGILPGTEVVPDERAKFQKTLLDNPTLVQKAKIHQTKSGLVVSFSEAGFFAPGESVINAEADGVIKTLAESLQSNQMQIRVEGHTDSTPISNAKFSSNWELSTSRAANVLQKLVENAIAPERLSAAGYGGFQPVADNSTPEGRAQNRRVDVVILNR
ncbi:MAG: OmpA family protein [Actinomycetota bacterium]